MCVYVSLYVPLMYLDIPRVLYKDYLLEVSRKEYDLIGVSMDTNCLKAMTNNRIQ